MTRKKSERWDDVGGRRQDDRDRRAVVPDHDTSSLAPATTRTAARSRRSARFGRRPLPRPAPTIPPTAAAAPQSAIPLGSAARLAGLPSRPAKELTQMNAAETAAVGLGSAQWARSRRGERKIPPPTPVSPESSPIAAPQKRAAASGGVWSFSPPPRKTRQSR